MQKRIYLLAACLAMIVLGCGTDETVREVREMRTGGHVPEAREHALAALQQDPSRMDLWLEFVRVDVEQARMAIREENPEAMNYLVEASLLCGAYYKYKNQNPPRDWKDVSKLVAGEALKQANLALTSLRAQAQSADYLNELLQQRRGDAGLDGARMSAIDMVEGYRANARELLFRSVLAERLLEMLPEISSGSSTMLITQLQTARDMWRQSLELPNDLVDTIVGRANNRLDIAMGRAMDDFQTLGYVVPGTITDNGVLGS